MSCYGIANYEDEKLVSVKLTVDDNPVAENGSSGKYNKKQNCFNKIYNEYIKQGKDILNVEELKQFSHKFNEICM